MNTIPLLFNERQINHTILGGTEKPEKVLMPVTCLVLNRSASPYRTIIFDSLLRHGFESIICVEPYRKNFSIDINETVQLYPAVKFVVPHDEVTPGDMLNLGFAAAQTDYVLVLQDDLCTEDFQFTTVQALRFMEKGQFCVCPRLISSNLQTVPSFLSPSVQKAVFTVDSSSLISDGSKTLYAFDLAGFYNREKFMQLGGADYTIVSPYWQKLDLFFRAWLWGETVSLSVGFTLSYSGALPEENQTVDFSYLRFYLKNLMPVYTTDHAEIPLKSFFAFNTQTTCGLGESVRLFKDAREWTKKNKYRFKKDATSLIENWEK